MYRAERDARAAWERAVSRATAWLETHPRVRPQELQVIALIAGGLDTDRIARQMGISPHTVREYIRDVSSRWQVRGRPQLVGRAYELGYLRIEPVGRLS